MGRDSGERSTGSAWRETTLGKVIELKRGYDLPQHKRTPGSISVVSSSGPTDYHSESKVQGPGVVTGRYGTLGQVFFIPNNFWPLNTALYVRDFKGNDPRFISYFLRGIDFSAYSDKAAVPGLNRNHLHQEPVRIPTDINEQRAIAHILGTLDDKIELNRRMNETLEEMARALFKDWFVDFGPTRAKVEGRAPYLAPELWDLFPDALDDEGKPVGWYQSSLGNELSVLETGKRPRGGVAGISEGIPSVGAESIVKVGEFVFSKTKYVPRDFFSKMTKGHVSDGDVLIYKDGGKPGELRPAVTYVSKGFPFAEFCINEHVFRIRAESLSQPLLYCLLSTDDAFWQMRELATVLHSPD